MLRDAVDRGTGNAVREAGFRGPAAGKTGTTNDATDVWFTGYTPELVGTQRGANRQPDRVNREERSSDDRLREKQRELDKRAIEKVREARKRQDERARKEREKQEKKRRGGGNR